jgi:hypothetical protein
MGDEAGGAQRKKLSLRGQRTQWADGVDSGQLNQRLPSARSGSPVVFRQLLMKIPQTKLTELSNWLPDRWKIGHSDRMASFNTISHPS